MSFTKHGLERVIERNFEVEEVIELFTKPDITRMQKDGAKVFIKQVGENCYNFASVNLTRQEVITPIRHIDKNALINLGKKYGWIL